MNVAISANAIISLAVQVTAPMDLRGFIAGKLEQLHLDFPIRIDSENFRGWNLNTSVRQGIGNSITKSSVERSMSVEETMNISKASHFKDFRLSQNDLATPTSSHQ